MASEIIGQIACFVFASALLGLAFFRADAKSATRIASIATCFVLVTLGAVGPQSILDLNFKMGGTELSFSRHQPTESERELAVAYAFGRQGAEGESAKLLEQAESRSDKERAPTDYLMLAGRAIRSEDTSQALELAYRGLALEPEQEVRASLQAVVGQALRSVEEKKLSAAFFDRAAVTAPELKADVQRLRATDLRRRAATP